MKPTLFVDDRSPPVRSCLMLLDELNIDDVNLVQIDLFKREQFAPEYLTISPQHSVPALQHDGLTLNDSHTILIYLAQKYQQQQQSSPGTVVPLLLPTNGTREWFLVFDRLLFNGTTLFRRDSDAFTEIFAKQPTDIAQHLIRLAKLFDMLETFLGRTQFMATDYMTIADLSVVATVSTINIILPVDAAKWPLLGAWFDRMRARPSYRKRNVPGLRRLRAVVESVAKFELPPDAEADSGSLQ